MGRAPLPLGSWGLIRVHPVQGPGEQAVRFRAIANFRNYDGVTRPVEASGRSKTQATQNLRHKLQTRSAAGSSGELTGLTKFSDAAELWMRSLEEMAEDGRRSPGTVEIYARQLRNHVLPAMSGLRLGEVTTPTVDKVIAAIRRQGSPATAKVCRTVVSGVMGLAVRHGAVQVNPVREIQRIESRPRRSPRALTQEERVELLSRLREDPVACRRDLPDLVLFMLATGVRIGEALALLWREVDLETGTASITSTLIRVKGEGLLRKPTKSRAGVRILVLPPTLTAILGHRFRTGARMDQPVFPSIQSGFRDPSNVRRELRQARGEAGLSWITSHSFRKTAATILDESALSARVIADQLGHARPSMTQDVYLGRQAVDERAALALERGLRDTAPASEKRGKGMDASPREADQVDGRAT